MLTLSFFNRSAPVVAQELLGKELIHTLPTGQILSGYIVETEAYLQQNDLAAHSARGNTPATTALRMGPGTLYIHPMRQYVGVDIVCAGGSVLLRALQPHQGFPESLVTLANGPGKLTRALGITKALYGLNVTSPTCPIHVGKGITSTTFHTTPRIGITKDAHLPLRFHLASPYISGAKKAPRRRP